MGAVITAKSGYDLGYAWRNQGKEPERSAGGYYLNAALGGEAAGRWFGPGLEPLGLVEGQLLATEADKAAYYAVYQQINPLTGEKLGRYANNAGKTDEDRAAYLAKLLEAEPHATWDRHRELAREAARMTRQTAPYTDVTVSFSKSISVLHASIRENARQARLAGAEAAAAWWDGREAAFQEVLQAADLAAMRHAQEWAGMTRTGYHGAKVDGQETGRWEAARVVASSWLQGTSRDGDPHDHVHNQFARMVQTVSDGKWRALDTVALRNQLPAMQAIASAHAEAGLTRVFGVEWVPRADGAGNEIRGVTQKDMDANSSRAVAIEDATADAVRQWSERYGRAPNRRELLYIKNDAWEATREGKAEGAIDWDALGAKWDAALGGKLAQVARGTSPALRGPGSAPAAASPGIVLSAEARAATVSKALVRVQEQNATWTRADLTRAVNAALPASSRAMGEDKSVALVHELTAAALSGGFEPVVPMEAPEWPALPEYLRRDLDGRSDYTRPGSDRYATRVQLSLEERLLTAARREGAPCLSREDAAGLLGADADALDAQLHERAQNARDTGARASTGLRLDQAAAGYHLLTSPRTVEVLVGPAGSGKTRTLAEIARAWIATGRPVIGLATSQAARNVLAAAGVPLAQNTSVFLGHSAGRRGALGVTPLAPGTLILADESSMMSTPDLHDIAALAARNGHKLVVAGDHAQLAAVESGGGMNLLVTELGHVQLAEAVRFAEQWERDASLRLRARDVAALDEYDDRGRIRGNGPEEAMEDARRLYVAEYLQGTDVELIVWQRDAGREMARRIRDDLQHLGIVALGPEVRLAEGARASAGDVIVARKNDHAAGVANSDFLRIEAVHDDGSITVRRRLDRDEVTGQRTWAAETFRYRGCDTADLSYGATAHTEQGKTVTAAIPLVTGGETAEWLYSALTRGAARNIACVFTQGAAPADPTPGTRAAPEIARRERIAAERAALPAPAQDECSPAGKLADPREAVAVLADILGRSGAEMSALETQRRNLASADHLAILNAQWQGETAGLQARRYRQVISDVLPETHRAEDLDSRQATWLWRTMRAAEAAGLDIREVAERAVADRSLAGARDVASVIDARIRRENGAMIPSSWRPWSNQVPEAGDPGRQRFLTELAEAMDSRKDRLGEFAVEHQPPWAVNALGPVPEEPLGRLEWERRAAHVGAYRELYGWDHESEPVGPEPSGDAPEKREAWHAAFGAMNRTEGIDLRDRADGSLHLMRDTYLAETDWAPAHVADELRAVRSALVDQAAASARADAEAEVARSAGDLEVAGRHEALAASAREAGFFYRQVEDMDGRLMEDRQEWARVTEGSRHLAVMADAELRRRYPDAGLAPLRSAEPAPAAAAVPELPADDAAGASMLARSAEQSAAFRDRLESRLSVPVPAEDPDYEADGDAWPSAWPGRDRDAVLQPPAPSIRPAEAVMEAAAEREAGR